jgi:hypothetical protein
MEHCITEHTLDRVHINEDHLDRVRLFRAPIVTDASGDHRRLPHEITKAELSVGDLVLAIGIGTIADGVCVIEKLEFWHVVKRLDSEYEFVVRINSLVGMGAYGDTIYDKFAAMLKLPPSGPSE